MHHASLRQRPAPIVQSTARAGRLTHDAGGDELDGRRWKELSVAREGVLV